MYAGPSPSLRGRWRTSTYGELRGEPVGELAGAVGRVVVDHEHAVAVAQHLAERAHHRARGSRARCRSGGRRWRASAAPVWRTYDRPRGRRRLPRNAELAAQLDLLADLMELEGGDGFRIAAYRRAATRIRETPALGRAARARGPREGAPGDRQDDRGEDRRGRRGRRDPRAHEAQGGRPGRGRVVHAPAGARPEDGAADLEGARDHDRRRPARGRRGAAAARARRARREVGGEDPRGARAGRERPRGRSGALLGTALPRLRAVAAELAAHPAAVEVSIAGSARRFRETVRDLDIIATATDAAGADRGASATLPWVVEVAARGDDEGDRRRRRTASASTSASCRRSRYGNLLQHFTGSKDHNVALREAAVRRGLSVSEYGVTEVETGEVHAFATEEEVYAFLGYAWIPPELREDGGELEAARRGDAAGPRRARRPARRPAHAHDLVGRQGHARGDGRRGDRGAATTTTRSATTRTASATGGSSSRPRRSTRCDARRAAPAPQGDRGEHPRRRRRSTWPTRTSRRSTGSSPRCTRASTADPTERVLAAMENPYVDCIGHLTEPQDRPARRRRRSTSSA